MQLPFIHPFLHNTPLQQLKMRIRVISCWVTSRTDHQTAARSKGYPNLDLPASDKPHSSD